MKIRRLISIALPLAMFAASVAAASAGEKIALLTRATDWKVATPFKPAGLRFNASSPTEGRTLLTISSHGDSHDIGGWVRALPKLQKGNRYHLEAVFTITGIDAPQRHVWAFVTTGGREFLEFNTVEKRGDQHLSLIHI